MAGINHRMAFHALALIKTRGPISRKNLAGAMGLGEGKTRALLDALENARLIERRKRGAVLARKGEKALSGISMHRVVIDLQGLVMDIYNVAVRIRGGASMVGNGLEQRDEAIRAGAKGATTLVYKGKDLWLPAHPEPQAVKHEITGYLRDALGLAGGDAIVIGSGPNYDVAEAGALYAALSILPKKSFI